MHVAEPILRNKTKGRKGDLGKNEFTKLTPNKNRKNVLKYQSHSPCLFINNQISSLFYLCLFCKKFFCIFLNICYLFCSQIHKIAVIHRAIRILYIHHLSIFLSNRIEGLFHLRIPEQVISLHQVIQSQPLQ